jgi:hypothetical protein
MDLPFRVCVDAAAPGGGFWLWGPGQPSGIGGFLDDEGTEPFFILSTDYEPGVSLGGYPPTPRYFRLTLRWDSAGSRPGALVAEVCGAEPVLLRFGAEAAPKARSCGEWVPLLSALAFPVEAARR